MQCTGYVRIGPSEEEDRSQRRYVHHEQLKSLKGEPDDKGERPDTSPFGQKGVGSGVVHLSKGKYGGKARLDGGGEEKM